MNKTLLFGFALLITLLGQPILADNRLYQIEVVVFSQNLPTTETFNQTDSLIQWPAALTELSAYQQAEISALKEGAIALFKDSTYEPIAQFSWSQSLGQGNTMLPVHLQSPDGKLDGYVQLLANTSYELIADLELKSAQMDRSGKPYLYRLIEKRFLKLNEVQYLDHPKFGVVMTVR